MDIGETPLPGLGKGALMSTDVQPNTVYGEGRRCCHVDEETGEQCITRLCRMNPGPGCFTHTRKSMRVEDEPARRRDLGAYGQIDQAA